MRRVMYVMLAAAAAVALSATPAHADGFVSPWAGVHFGSDVDNGRGAFGVNAGYMGAGIIGGELDFGYSPSFFGTQNDFGHNTVIDVMGNLIVGVPIGGTHGAGFRPFVAGGVGLVRTQMDGGTVATVSSSRQSIRLWISVQGRWGISTSTSGFAETFAYFGTFHGDVVNGIDLGDRCTSGASPPAWSCASARCGMRSCGSTGRETVNARCSRSPALGVISD